MHLVTQAFKLTRFSP
ncbi:hypothetical protein FOXB_05804 [Fusarium oxysporum f. sp. conglutinans Fo5176]|uniref:Uncharacterized protein n=1 Tax=Fusarium oxysporum (strain Fo5176) TaxID=660025 RepID=F9FHC5_FUSOF|nr:hypothetical protein FOXB_05804 [Fusarium oxysporum f. sp. conglutinans Fo5176]